MGHSIVAAVEFHKIMAQCKTCPANNESSLSFLQLPGVHEVQNVSINPKGPLPKHLFVPIISRQNNHDNLQTFTCFSFLKEFDEMAQIESIKRWGQKSGGNLIHSFSIEHAVSANRSVIGICSVILLFCWASTCIAGGTGPAIGFKVGAQTIDSLTSSDKTTRTRFELEFSSPRFGDDYFDLALTLGGSSLGSFDEEYVGFDDGVLIEEYYTDHYSLIDLRLAGRFYPLGDNSRLKPYVGAGVGYFWFLDSWEYEYYETYEDPYIPGLYYTYADAGEERDTLAKGFFPFVTAGLTVPLDTNFELQFEVQYHYDKEDSGFDFGGPVYMFGCNFRF